MSKNYSIFDIVKDTVSGNVQKTDTDQRQRRIDICNICPERNSVLNICKKCGCYIPNKTSYALATCPIGKW
jgi:hypothetical protein